LLKAEKEPKVIFILDDSEEEGEELDQGFSIDTSIPEKQRRQSEVVIVDVEGWDVFTLLLG
jgi:hypothetical protein